MLPETPYQTAGVLFVLVFVVQTLHRKRFGWLLAASVLWFAAMAAAVWQLSQNRILMHDGSLLLTAMEWSMAAAHGFVFLASAVFFAGCIKKQPETRPTAWSNTRGDVFLTLLAVSGLLMHAAFFTLSAIIWYHLPTGMSVFYPAQLLQLYLFDPVNWYGCQAVLMGLFYLHRTWLGNGRADMFTLPQLSSGFLLALFWQYLYVVLNLAALFMR